MQVTMKVEGLDAALRDIANLPKQVRFGASIGLNRTMSEAQDAIRDGLGSRFTLRRATFVKNTIYRKPGVDWATKDKLEAGVRVNPERNILAKFEAGGTKSPTGGRRFLAVPVAVKRNKFDIVTKANSLKALLANKKAYIRDGKVWLLSGAGKIKKRTLAYIFKAATPLPSSLHFVDTATRVINARAVANIEGAITAELTTGLTTRNGPRL
jgi:hypothetical protein